MGEVSIEERVKDIVARMLGKDKAIITRESDFREDLEADSLDLIELIMEFEKAFGGDIDDADVQKIKTVGEAVDYIEKNLKKK